MALFRASGFHLNLEPSVQQNWVPLLPYRKIWLAYENKETLMGPSACRVPLPTFKERHLLMRSRSWNMLFRRLELDPEASILIFRQWNKCRLESGPLWPQMTWLCQTEFVCIISAITRHMSHRRKYSGFQLCRPLFHQPLEWLYDAWDCHWNQWREWDVFKRLCILKWAMIYVSTAKLHVDLTPV